MRILVTGSRGVIGSWLMKKLIGHDVFGIDLFHADGEAGFIQKMGHDDTYARCDISDYRQIERIISKGFDLVYNCAAEFGRWNGEDFYEQLWKSNAIGFKNLLKLKEIYGFKLIHFSSSEVYGDFPGVMTENVMDLFPIKQMNDYAISKWVNELQINNSGSQDIITVRLFNTYGPGEWYHPYRSVNCKFCYHALMGYPVTVYTGHLRTSTYIEDCVDALVLFADNFIPAIYNIAGSTLHSIEELVEIIWDHTGASRSLITFGTSEKSTTKRKTVDNSKIVAMGFNETVNLSTGIKNTLEWMTKYYNL